MVEIAVGSLAVGHHALLHAPAGKHFVTVARVRVCDAGAAREMLRGDRWVLRNKTIVKKLVQADGVLALLEATVIPALFDDSRHGPWNMEFLRLGKKLDSLAGHIGRGFNLEAKSIGKHIKDRGAEIRDGKKSLNWRSNRLRNLLARVTELR